MSRHVRVHLLRSGDGHDVVASDNGSKLSGTTASAIFKLYKLSPKVTDPHSQE